MTAELDPQTPPPPTPALQTPRPAQATHPTQRSWLDVRVRQARNPPPPVLRAVLANLAVAAVGGVIVLIYDTLLSRGVPLPGGDLRTAVVAIYVVVVIVAGSVLTYLWVELPTGSGTERRRSGWAALLGFFASLPIVYLSLVVIFQLVAPLLR
jgi:hypothetical protein